TQCNSFLADRFIQGECPYCHYESARGDQCDECGKLLQPSELINPQCAHDGTQPEFKSTTHLFLQLDKLQPVLESWVKEQSKTGSWTPNALQTTNAWFKEGLKSRAITRDLLWGIPIPESAFEGRYKDKVFYVWFDAPIGYISITQQLLGDDYKTWWNAPDDVDLYQFMGKDNTPFHSIIFPATLLATSNIASEDDLLHKKMKYTLPYHLDVTEYLNYEHTKFSKSRNIGVFGDNAKDSGLPSDIFRYVLLYNRPEHGDTQFTWKGLQERLNNELVANIGNFVHRTLSFAYRFLNASIQPISLGDLKEERYENFLKKYNDELATHMYLMKHVRLREALHQILSISRLGNQFFQEQEPWKTKTTNRERCEKDISFLAHIAKDLALLLEPFMPETAHKILHLLFHKKINYDDLGEFSLQAIPNLEEPQILFSKIDDKQVELLQEKYGFTKKSTKEPTKESTKNSILASSLKSDSSSKKDLKHTLKNKPEDVLQDEQKDASKDKEKNKQKGKKRNKKKQVASLNISDVELVVGKILDVKAHPDADKLYVETISFDEKDAQGQLQTSTIVSGLVPYYTIEELLGQKVVVVKNLAPAKLRGVKSYGMLLAAEHNGVVGIITAPQAKIGAKLFTNENNDVKKSLEDVEDEQSSPKKQISFEEFMTLSFRLSDSKLYLNNQELFVKDAKIICKRLENGQVR
ncbi:MAG: methionine--tRNA ligase, partial [Candidatus Nanoarchaeia archaeon]